MCACPCGAPDENQNQSVTVSFMATTQFPAANFFLRIQQSTQVIKTSIAFYETRNLICNFLRVSLWTTTLSMSKQKGKVGPVHAMKAYWCGGIAPHILNLSIRWEWVVSLTTLPPYFWRQINREPLNKRLAGLQDRCEVFAEKKNILNLPWI